MDNKLAIIIACHFPPMATGIVLSPPSQDCLRDLVHNQTLASTSQSPSSNSLHRQKHDVDSSSSGRNRLPIRDRRRLEKTIVVKTTPKNLVMEQVRILKRGEKISDRSGSSDGDCISSNSLASSEDIELDSGCGSSSDSKDFEFSSTDPFGPDPEIVKKEVSVSKVSLANAIYAGSVFVTSPPPSSLPIPAFCNKVRETVSQSSDLRRLLRLDKL